MLEEYIKKGVVDGKVILNRIVTSEVSKERVLARLTDQKKMLQNEITDKQAELVEIQAKIESVEAITAKI